MAGTLLTLAVAVVCSLAVLVGPSFAQGSTTPTTTTTTTNSPDAASLSSSPAPSLPGVTTAVGDAQSTKASSTPSTMSSSSTTTVIAGSSSTTTSTSTDPSTSTRSTMSSSVSAGASSSTIVQAGSTTTSSTAGFGNGPVNRRKKDPVKARWIAAVVSGCGLFVLTFVSFTVIAFIIRSTIRLEKRKIMKALPRRSIAADGQQFYSGLEPYSAQALVSSLSGSSIAVSHASDVHLDSHAGGRGIYHNRGFDGHHDGPLASTSSGGSDGNGHFEESYKPIEIKASKGKTETSRHSEA